MTDEIHEDIDEHLSKYQRDHTITCSRTANLIVNYLMEKYNLNHIETMEESFSDNKERIKELLRDDNIYLMELTIEPDEDKKTVTLISICHQCNKKKIENEEKTILGHVLVLLKLNDKVHVYQSYVDVCGYVTNSYSKGKFINAFDKGTIKNILPSELYLRDTGDYYSNFDIRKIEVYQIPN